MSNPTICVLQQSVALPEIFGRLDSTKQREENRCKRLVSVPGQRVSFRYAHQLCWQPLSQSRRRARRTPRAVAGEVQAASGQVDLAAEAGEDRAADCLADVNQFEICWEESHRVSEAVRMAPEDLVVDHLAVRAAPAAAALVVPEAA